jgi:hypothetical protein
MKKLTKFTRYTIRFKNGDMIDVNGVDNYFDASVKARKKLITLAKKNLEEARSVEVECYFVN